MNKFDMLVAILGLTDLTLITITSSSPPTETGNILTYLFDLAVIGLIVYTFSKGVKDSLNRRRYVLSSWYGILGMIPVTVFVIAGQISVYYDGFLGIGIMLRLLGVIYLIRQSQFIGNRTKILGGNKTLQIFILFYLVLTISAFFFYIAEHSNGNSQITSMGDALWWTVQAVTTSTFGPNATTAEGRIIGTIVMLIGIAITGTFISTLAIGLTRSRSKNTRDHSEEDPRIALKIRLAKGEITKEEYMELAKLISQ